MRIHLVSARWTTWGGSRANTPEESAGRFDHDVYEALVAMGHEVIDTDYRQNRLEIPKLLKIPCDLVLVLKGEGIRGYDIKNAGGPTVLWYPDDLRATVHAKIQISLNGRVFDRVYSFSHGDLEEYHKLDVDAKWLPLGCNPRLHRKLPVERIYDTTFVGAIYPDRQKLIDQIRRFYPVRTFSAYGVNMALVFNISRININLGIGQGGINHRVFEALGCGGFLLTNRPDSEEEVALFEDKKHLVYWDDPVSQVGYYLEHPEEAEAIAEAGMQEVLAKHTVMHRMAEILA